LQAKIAEAKRWCGQAADMALKARERADASATEAAGARECAKVAETVARNAMESCDDLVTLLGQIPTTPAPEPQPTPAPTPTPTPTPPPGPVTPGQVDQLHYRNFLHWWDVPDPPLEHDPAPGQGKHLYARRYAELPALPGGWQSRLEPAMLRNQFGGNMGLLANWRQTADALFPAGSMSQADFSAMLRMAVLANQGKTG
jgi:hypothetical protein